MAAPQLANSINGYVAKLIFRQRTQRTLLVEGGSDKIILSSLLLRVGRSKHNPPILIDTAETIKNTGLGNRERVEEVHAVARQHGVIGYACLADREFRDFKCAAPYEDSLAGHRIHENVLFWTRGHSVENYLFVVESVQRYLEITYASILPVSYVDLIEAAFYPLMMQAVAFSLAAYEATVISRSDRIIELQNWSFDAAGQPCLDIAQVTAALSVRAATAEQTALFISSYLAHLAAVPTLSLPFLRWISHGHLGSQVLWSGIAYLFSQHGFDTDSVEQLWRGQNDSKCKIGADLWAQRCAGASPEETPTMLMAWLAAA